MTTAQTRRILFSLAVLLWAGCMLYFYGSGRIVKYLAPDFRPIVLVGGLGLAVMGFFNLLTSHRHVDCGHDHGGDDEEDESHGHDHDHDSSDLNPYVAFLLMVVPLVLSVFWTKDTFSQTTLARKGLYDDVADMGSGSFFSSMMPALTLEQIESSHRRTSDGFLEFDLMELYFGAADVELRNLLEGLSIQTEGRIVEEKINNDAGTRMRLYRMFMTCCAADAKAIPIILEFGAEPPELPKDGWVSVAGTMRFPTEGGSVRPVLKIERATAAESPPEEKFFLR